MVERYQIRKCLREGCALRYPVVEGHPYTLRCPRCRGETRQVLERSLLREPLVGQGVKPSFDFVLEGLLDNIRSGWNVGSIFRSADGAGIRRLHLCGFTPTPDAAAVRKTSLGAEESVAWETCRDGIAAAHALLECGARLWALEQDARSKPIEEAGEQMAGIHPGVTVVLVVGNEICGVDPGILELCEAVWHLPMMGAKRSFNVAVAFGIAAYVLGKRA